MEEAYSKYYDAIYAFKDYENEAQKIVSFVEDIIQRPAGSLLDIACGTGKHLEHFSKRWYCEGLDLSLGQVRTARSNYPHILIHNASMTDFHLERKFDVITCLFSAVGHLSSVEELNMTLLSMANHLQPGGLILIEPWFEPDQWMDGTPHLTVVNEPNLKIARANVSSREGNYSILDLHYLIATPERVESMREVIKMYLFTKAEYQAAFTKAGLSVSFDQTGITGRGLYIGTR